VGAYYLNIFREIILHSMGRLTEFKDRQVLFNITEFFSLATFDPINCQQGAFFVSCRSESSKY